MNYSILFKLLEEGLFFSQQHYFCGSQGADPSWAAKRVRERFHQRCTKLSPNRDWQGQCHADPATLLITFTGLYWKVLWKVPWPSNPDVCCKRSALLRMSVLISTAFAKSSASCSLFVSHSPFGANVAWILDMSHHFSPIHLQSAENDPSCCCWGILWADFLSMISDPSILFTSGLKEWMSQQQLATSELWIWPWCWIAKSVLRFWSKQVPIHHRLSWMWARVLGAYKGPLAIFRSWEVKDVTSFKETWG